MYVFRSEPLSGGKGGGYYLSPAMVTGGYAGFWHTLDFRFWQLFGSHRWLRRGQSRDSAFCVTREEVAACSVLPGVKRITDVALKVMNAARLAV